MERNRYALARRLRDSDLALVLVALASAVALGPLVLDFATRWATPGELALSVSWWLSTAILTAYAGVHVVAAVADARRFLDDHGTEYATGPAVFCHALGQRLFALLAVALALVFLAVTGAGTAAPAALLAALGLFAAALCGLSVAVPMNRRVSERLAEYRDG